MPDEVHKTSVKRANGGVRYECDRGCPAGNVQQTRLHGNNDGAAWRAAETQGHRHEREKNKE